MDTLLEYFNPAELMPHPDNRTIDDGPEMEELCASIREFGIIRQPIVRRKTGEIWPEILSGHRRVHAAKKLGMEHIQCIVRECDDDEAMAILFVENFEQLALNPIEEAEGLDSWMRICSLSIDDIARRIKRPAEYVQSMLALNDLPQEARKLVRAGSVSRDTLLVLGKVDAEDYAAAAQLVLFPSFQDQPLNPRQAAQVIKEAIITPRQRQQKWDSQRDKAKKLFEVALPTSKIVVPTWLECEFLAPNANWINAELPLSTVQTPIKGLPIWEKRPDSSKNIWADLATKHELEVFVLPYGDERRSVVRFDLIMEGERSMHEAGMITDMIPVKTAPTSNVESADEDPDEESDSTQDNAPPDERHVRREAGTSVIVPKERVKRCVEVLDKWRLAGRLEDSELLDIPKRLVEQIVGEHAEYILSPSAMSLGAVIALEWILEGCPTAILEKED